MFTPAEVARQLKVSQETIRRFCRRGAIQAVKVGRQWRIPPEALHAYLKTNTRRPQ